MRRGYVVALLVAGCLAAAPREFAQTQGAVAGQNQQADTAQKPAAEAPQAESNPFPADTSNVPVLPSNNTPVLPQPTFSGSDNGAAMESAPLAGEDLDPVRSPDDPIRETGSGEEQGWSSSQTAMDRIVQPPDDERRGKKSKQEAEIEPEHKETSKEDISVGNYYLDTKDWKGALSRFQSALVLDPENPDVYWGLAECEHHLGDFADARANYIKVMEYDPDSRHAKDARKALKEPELANARSVATGEPAAGTVK